MSTWTKANIDGFVLGSHASATGIFHDHMGPLLGCFASNLGNHFALVAELLGFIIVMKHSLIHGWTNLWIEGDSTSALLVFKNFDLVHWCFRNIWPNCLTVKYIF